MTLAVANQRIRQNLTDADFMRLRRIVDERFAKGGDRGNQHTGGKPEANDPAKASSDAIAKSAARTAELIGTSPRKVEKLRAIDRDAEPEIKQAIEPRPSGLARAITWGRPSRIA